MGRECKEVEQLKTQLSIYFNDKLLPILFIYKYVYFH